MEEEEEDFDEGFREDDGDKESFTERTKKRSTSTLLFRYR